MNLDFTELPPAFLGAAQTTLPDKSDGDFQMIGILLQFPDVLQPDADGRIATDAEYALFVMPPTISLAGEGEMSIDLRSREVQFTSSTGQLEFRALLSENYQTLEGEATFREFELLDVQGDFADCPMILEADHDPGD